MLERGKFPARGKAGAFGSVRAQAFAGTHQQMREHRIVLHDLKRQLPQFVAGRLGFGSAGRGHDGRNAGRAGRDVQCDKR